MILEFLLLVASIYSIVLPMIFASWVVLLNSFISTGGLFFLFLALGIATDSSSSSWVGDNYYLSSSSSSSTISIFQEGKLPINKRGCSTLLFSSIFSSIDLKVSSDEDDEREEHDDWEDERDLWLDEDDATSTWPSYDTLRANNFICGLWKGFMMLGLFLDFLSDY